MRCRGIERRAYSEIIPDSTADTALKRSFRTRLPPRIGRPFFLPQRHPIRTLRQSGSRHEPSKKKSREFPPVQLSRNRSGRCRKPIRRRQSITEVVTQIHSSA